MMKQALLTLRHTTLSQLVVAGLLASSAISAQAALFGDDEARRAIIELRQRADSLQQSQEQTRRSLLDLQSQIEALKADQAKLRGQNEQLIRDSSELQRGQKDLAKGFDERLRQFEPVSVNVDGMEFTADRSEKQDFDQALGLFRSGKFPEAAQAFAGILRQWPKSGYTPSVRFWLGNSQYATRDYKNAIANFRSVLTNAPMHMRAPEAALSIANCQVELKETKAARKTLEDLLQAYPNSEAAGIAKPKLATLK
ncbi:tol-pal system protein YbgF [Comamonas sp. Y33R10-2]|uniref:tol-pal system protein YbgF n=1 Tax=Comamonas sp. Y33R10-2 TaxID=2853257 RepID=UPI001C5C9ED2|nr:tol-pal system protein YbgF [Comamonas sp. Y33R10-2]QXZ08423.1 tol-pal system protein YbgF [Comamonas sp. Y33R10-2]